MTLNSIFVFKLFYYISVLDDIYLEITNRYYKNNVKYLRVQISLFKKKLSARKLPYQRAL